MYMYIMYMCVLYTYVYIIYIPNYIGGRTSNVATLQELERFLLKCFEKSPIQRPGAAVLLEDPWIQGNKRHMFCS